EISPFARADLEFELLMVDDDMRMEALPQTNNIKTIVTSETPMDMERKGKQSYQGTMYARLIGFGNGTLKSKYDQSLGFFRRQIILHTRDKAPGRIDDPFLSDKLKSELDGIFLWDESARLRETDLLRYEIGEIEAAALRPGEEEALAAEHKKMQNARRIMESLGAVREAFGSEGYDNASDRIGKAARALAQAAEYDPRIAGMHETAETIESLAGDLLGEVNTYLDDLSFSGEDQARVEERLDLIRNIEAKYGRGYEEVMAALESRTERLAVLEDLDRRKALLEKELADAESVLKDASEELSALRMREAGKLAEEIRGHLEDLNFLQVRFSVELSRTEGYTANGIDEAEFYISTNPGEDLQPLAKVASGGELSRVMLAVKTVLADADDIGTLIFDEIDAGISGRTAQKVSEKLALIAKSRQVICITHLAQIAAMADRHFRIEKRSGEDKTSTYISALGERETVEELARILGGVAVTEAVMDNAREMKQLALELKLQRHS
ncbi:MAG: hypothetical protein IIY92_01255, partial [Lachnospiraceae bacterium]|nr:hypothetical protein [Lachnospiraceae bacterium]